MKIISLNTAHGLYFNQFKEFIIHEAESTDIFCFQEISNGNYPHRNITNLLSELQLLLPKHQAYNHNTTQYDAGTITTFIHTNIHVLGKDELLLANEKTIIKEKEKNNSSLDLITTIEYNKQHIDIHNFHGLWHPWHKLDTTLRDQQTHILLDYIDNSKDTIKILIGDFNLHPNTKLITELWKRFTDINKKFNITDTRGEWSFYYGKDDYQPYADYAFTSYDLCIESYETYEKTISDHKALILNISL